jgi:hypothetical protein
LDKRPTTEEHGGLTWDQQLAEPEVKSGVLLPRNRTLFGPFRNRVVRSGARLGVSSRPGRCPITPSHNRPVHCEKTAPSEFQEDCLKATLHFAVRHPSDTDRRPFICCAYLVAPKC